jgi:hypothetical protein
MSINLRLPSISQTGNTAERLGHLERYLFSLTEQLQWALNNMEASAAGQSNVPTIVNKSETVVVENEFDAEVAFADLKPLIIKSADIITAYYEEVKSRLAGIFVAESDFGTFYEKTELYKRETSTAIEQVYSNVQGIETHIDNLDFTLAEVNAHVKTGKLYDDDSGVPVYGLEIGQKTMIDGEEIFNKFARFTSDRLSFYDQNGTEVAYVSDFKLYIRSVEITKSLKIGGYVDTVTDDGRVITKWVGGSNG